MVKRKNKKRQIIVAGDVWIDNLLVRATKQMATDNEQKWNERDTLRQFALPGGALLIRDMLKTAAGKSGNMDVDVVSYKVKHVDESWNGGIIQSLAQGRVAPGTDSVYIEKTLGDCEKGPETGVPSFALDFIFESSEKGDIVVIDDAHHGFREMESAWETIIEKVEANKNTWIIYNMSGPLFEGKAWHRITRANLLARTVLIIEADALRAEGVNISKKMSWDRTIADIVTFPAYKKFHHLEKCPHVLIRFGMEGIMYYYHHCYSHLPKLGKETERKAKMFYVPSRCENETMDDLEGVHGGVTDLSSVFAGFLTYQIAIGRDVISKTTESGKELNNDVLSQVIINSVGPAAEKVIQLAGKGYLLENDRLIYPFENVLAEKSPGLIKEMDIGYFDKGYLHGSRKNWSILSSRIPRDFDLNDIAQNYVIHGNVEKLDNVPVVQFGKLRTIDKNEIESFRSIKNLIKEYISDGSANKPISIAVFGPPGSGKSFAVKSVVKSVMGRNTEVLEYNLSQFESPLDIVRAFHEVRDYSLKGIVPLVFFDEFDSSYGGSALGWLKYFLAPMQDGEFKEGERSHPIGRAVFVFAGGTHCSLKRFSMESELEKKENGQSFKAFVTAKGPDFVSRLKGYVDILGPNPIDRITHNDTAPRFDRFAVIRRAVLLRVLLMQHKQIVDGKKIRIDSDVLRALLLIPKYKHGARSMNAVINMSMLNGKSTFEKATLPSPEQLSLHVDPDIFMNILERDLIIIKAEIDRKIHKIYRETQRTMPNPKPDTHPSMADWDKLEKDLKQNNRMLAENLPLKLLLINCNYRPKAVIPGKEKQLIAFTKDEIEYLARMAHEKWLEKKVSEGWTYGSPRNDAQMKHDCIVEWEELPEELKIVDRNTIKSIPHMFDTAGFEVYRL